jgi:adenosylcobinamide-GDP ribazoletransferase
MIFFKRFILMIQFLTAIPLPIKLDVNERDFGKGLVFAPLVGLIIGGILSGAYFLLQMLFPVYVSVVITIILYIVLTGGLHLDGLGDTFDGIFSNRPKERILEIMRDSRVGTNAVLAVVSLIILNIALLSAVDGNKIAIVLALMPVSGRIGSLFGAVFSNYARSGAGLGKSFIDYCGIKEGIAGLLIYLGIFYAIGGIRLLTVCAVPAISAVLLVKFFSRKIGGATGDVLGAVCEMNQTVFLVTVVIMQRMAG